MSPSVAKACVRGAVAIELQGGQRPARAALGREQAGELAARVARDLAVHAPLVRELDFVLAAAHFDPAELLRPGWPLHRRLQELHQRAPGQASGPRIIGFGADDDDAVPQPLQAEAGLAGGALRVLPFLLHGDAETAQAVGERFEMMLLEQGMAAADTALLAQAAFAAPTEHIRYLTVHDLAAMTAMQYQHQGLERLWPLLETALLQPQAEEWLDAPPEPLLRYAGGEVRVAMLDPAAWQRRCADGADGDRERLARAYEIHLARQRQLAAVLEAHGLPVIYVHCPAGQDPRALLQG